MVDTVTLVDYETKLPIGGSGSSGTALKVSSPTYTALGDGQLSNAQLATVGGVGLPSLPGTASVAIVQNNHTQPIRFRYKGATDAPTATVGQRIPVGQTVTLDVGAATLATVRLIYEATGTGTVDVSYFA